MDTLLLALLACLIGEMGDRSQSLSRALGDRFADNKTWVISGLIVAAAANAALSGWAGAFVGRTIGTDARGLFLGLALLAAGMTMLWPTKTPDPLSNWRIGPFSTSATGLFILGFGESAQFLIAGFAAARAEPMWAGLGGAAGVILACVPAIVGSQPPGPSAIRWVRRTGAAIFLVAGFVEAVQALGLS